MKNSYENKGRFFAQYWGQKVKRSHLPEQADWVDVVEHEVFRIFHLVINGYLELKPLSSITDEDAIEVAEVISSTSFQTKKKWEVERYTPEEVGCYCARVISKQSFHYFEIDSDGHLSVKDEESDSIPMMVLPDYLAAYDLLRRKGYAIPFDGISVEEQIQWGWVKLKE